MRAIALLILAVANAQVSDIHVDVSVVSVTATVSDRSGSPLTHLKREDFTLLDNGRGRDIQSFWQESDLPLTIGLLADVSGSQLRVIREHRETIAQFLSQVIGPQDRAFIVTIGPEVKLLTDLTSSVAELRNDVDKIEGSQRTGTQLGERCRGVSFRLGFPALGCGGSAIWNGVYAAAKLKMKLLNGRKALLVLSDGIDSGSKHSLTEAIEAAQSADTLVYTLRSVTMTPRMMSTIGGASALASSDRSMQRLAEETGGRASEMPKNPAAIFSQIEAELRNLYVLGFGVPADERDSKFHPLEVKVKIPNTVVRARKGYVPQPSL